MMFKKTTVIIPALNEAKTIKAVVEGVKEYCNEVIVIDDGSLDSTSNLAESAGAIVLLHEKNKGYELSIEDGFKEAIKRGADILITFDADGQHSPKDIRKLKSHIDRDVADVVIGDRKGKKHFIEEIFAFYTSFRYGINDPLSGFKAYSVKIYKDIGHFDTKKLIGSQLVIEAAKKGYKIKTQQISVLPREDKSRFYSDKIKANLKVFSALVKAFFL